MRRFVLIILTILWVSPAQAGSSMVMPLDAHTKVEFVKHYKDHIRRELKESRKTRNPLWRSIAAKLTVEDLGYNYSQTFSHYLIDEDIRNNPDTREIWAVVVWINGNLDEGLKQKIIDKTAYEVAKSYEEVRGISHRNITFLEALTSCLKPAKSNNITSKALVKCWSNKTKESELAIPDKNELSTLVERKLLSITSKPSLKMSGTTAPAVVSGKLKGVTIVFNDSYECKDLSLLKRLVKKYNILNMRK